MQAAAVLIDILSFFICGTMSEDQADVRVILKGETVRSLREISILDVWLVLQLYFVDIEV